MTARSKPVGDRPVAKKPDPNIHPGTNLTRKTDGRSGYKHGQFPNRGQKK